MSNGWETSAAAWIEDMGEQGDWSRRCVLDRPMMARVEGRGHRRALDIGCGEGRFCRMLQGVGISTVGIDPTNRLLEQAKHKDPSGDYRAGRAESLQFDEGEFDLVVSYLTLIDIDNFRAAISEMERVLAPGGTLLIANINSFVTASDADGWVTGDAGELLYFPLDGYLEETSSWSEWRGIRIENWHRPFSAYMKAFFAAGLELVFFDEPEPVSDDTAQVSKYRRVPWFHIMEWRKPSAP